MTAPIRWGILATGRIAATFVTDLKTLSDAQTVAVGSRSPEAAERFAEAHGIPRAHGSWQALADDPDVDVVYVATPHSAHYQATMTVLNAGKAALTEKPIALDTAQATGLVQAARDRNVFLMEAMWTRFFPAIARAQELIAEGAIGRVTGVHSDFGFTASDDPAHRLNAKELGGGALLDLGIYPVTIAHLFLGPPDEIRAWADLGEQGTDRNTAMIFGYASGALATLTCSLVGQTPTIAVISGSAGRIELPSRFIRPHNLTLYRGEQAEVIDLPVDGVGYHLEAAEVHRCLRAGRIESSVMTHAETLSVMTTLDRVREQIGVSYPG
jgi:predicted dehydrogenase